VVGVSAIHCRASRSKNIRHKKAQEAQEGKQQLSAYFAPFCGKHLIMVWLSVVIFNKKNPKVPMNTLLC
jgi:hypothetical protein